MQLELEMVVLEVQQNNIKKIKLKYNHKADII